MENGTIPGLFRRSLLFHLEAVRMHRMPAGEGEAHGPRNEYALFVVTGGEAELSADGRQLRALPGAVFVQHPQSRLFVRNVAHRSLDYISLIFSAIEMRGRPPRICQEGEGTPGYLLACPLNRSVRLIEQIAGHTEPLGALDDYKRQLGFQELMVLLIEYNSKPAAACTAKLIDDTLAYVQTRYMEDITVRQLSERAGVPQHRYTSLFQQATGMKPLDYLNRLRVEHSKEFLRNSGEPLREIARMVGYRDEYYFNRRFRQLTGRTPRQYTLTPHERVRVRDWAGRSVEIPEKPRRIVYYGETVGDLLALGAKVVGGSVYWPQRSELGEMFRHVVDIGAAIDSAELSRLEPDLIILASRDECKYAKAAEIAPTVTFDSFAPLQERMSVLGNLLGLRNSADQWLKSYMERWADMWHKLSAVLAPGESASVFAFDRGGRLFVMGTIGLPGTLYHESGF